MSKRGSATSWIVAVIVLVVVVIAGWFVFQRATGNQDDASPASAASTPAEQKPVNAPIAHPIASAQSGAAPASTVPLPALGQSDAYAVNGLVGLAGPALRDLLIPTQVIPRVVATVDALPRQALGRLVLPVQTAKGGMQTTEVDGRTVIDPANAQRYAAYMQALEQVDSQALVTWYVRNYALFQEAYVKLGYPKGYFNDRLIKTIDSILATPEPGQTPAVTKVQGHYAYANPSLEALPIGQKILLRAGPQDEAKAKAKLREIRSAITGQNLPGAG